MFSYKVLPLALLISLPAIAMQQDGQAIVLAQAAAATPVVVQKAESSLLDTVLTLETHDAIEARKQAIEARKQEVAKKLAEQTAALEAELKQAEADAESNTKDLEKLRDRKSRAVVGVDRALERLKTQYEETEKKKASELALEDAALKNILKPHEDAIALARKTFEDKKKGLEEVYDAELQKIRGNMAVQEGRLKEKGAQLNDLSLKLNKAEAKPATTEEKAKEATTPETSVGLLYYINPLNLFGRSTSQQ